MAMKAHDRFILNYAKKRLYIDVFGLSLTSHLSDAMDRIA